MKTLRPYQIEGMRAIVAEWNAGHNAVCYQLPTGGGKSAIAVKMTVANSVQRDGRTMIICHRRELIEQFHAALLEETSIPPTDIGLIQAGSIPSPFAKIQLASQQTLVKRKERIARTFRPNLLIIDEAHHAIAKTWKETIDFFTPPRILGLTATPARLDGLPLGKIFQKLVLGPSIGDLIDDGFLARYNYYAFTPSFDIADVKITGGDYNKEALGRKVSGKIVGEAVQNFLDSPAADQQAIFFGINIDHSKQVAAKFNERGIHAEHVDSHTDRLERAAAMERFRAGRTQILCNVDLFGEGVDVPAVGAVMLGRPTKSITVFRQQVGRTLRPAPGKTATIVDLVGNYKEHGAPDDFILWSLENRARKQKNRKNKGVVFVEGNCEKCDTFGRHRSREVGLFCEPCWELTRPRVRETSDGVMYLINSHKANRNPVGEYSHPPDPVPTGLPPIENIEPPPNWRGRAEVWRDVLATGGDMDSLAQLCEKLGYNPLWAIMSRKDYEAAVAAAKQK